jgi:hypothetical protein
MSRKRKPDGAPQGDGATEARAAGMRFRVVKNGKILAGATTEAEAQRLATYLDAEVRS